MYEKLVNRTIRFPVLLPVFCLLISAGCGKKGDGPTPPPPEPPRVLSAYPVDSAGGVARNSVVFVVFSKGMNKSATQGAFSANGATGSFHWFGNAMLFAPAASFGAQETVRVSVTSNAQDLDGNALSPAFNRWFVAGSDSDTTRPTVSALQPAAGDTGQPVGMTVTLRASEPVLQFMTGSVRLTDSLGNPVAGNTSWQDSVTVAFNSTADLAYNTRYTVSVDTILRDFCWNRNNAATWWFRTEVDASSPTVLSVAPSNGASAVSLRDSVVITFSEPMDTASVRAAFSTTPAVAGAMTWSGQTVARFKPLQVLAVHRSYAVSVGTGAADLSGNHLASPFSSSFTTDRVIYAASISASKVFVMSRSTGAEMQQVSVTHPLGLSCSPDGSKLYVIDGGAGGSLKVLDPGNSHQEVRSITLGSYPYAMNISASGTKLAVSNYVAGTVTVVDTTAWTSPLTFTVDAGPHGVALGNNRIFAACADAGRLSSYDMSGTFVDFVTIHATSQMMCLSASRDTIYLCEGDQISAFTASGFIWLGSAATDCQGVVRAGAYLYVSDPLNPRVRAYSPTPVGNFINHIQDITVGAAPRGLCATADGSRIYSANGSIGTVSEINTATNTVAKTITVGAAVDAVAASP